MVGMGMALALRARSARSLGHAPPGKFWIFGLSESVSDVF